MLNSLHPSTPILVGCADVTDTSTPAEAARSPFDLIAQAAHGALADTSAASLNGIIDSVAMIRLFADTSHRFASRLGTSTNPPKSVADRLGLQPREYIYTYSGGNMPQYMVNQYAERIANGEIRAAMLMGGEALRTQKGVERAGVAASWAEDPGGEHIKIGDPRRGWNDHEDRHNMRAAIAMYPLFEHAIRGTRSRTMQEHMPIIARLMSSFSKVASENPLATRREYYTAERLATVDEENPWIGFPYPRFMNSNAFIDQAAAVVMTSVGQATELGIPQDKWVFLHGCADGHDHWFVSERFDLHSSPAIRAASRLAFDMADKEVADMAFLDIYSCFASAVQIACQELGISEDDPRGLTITGGLPYFGGPGNNYVTHSISEMMRRVRAHPGKFGLVTANGNYVTKHSFGIYSTEPTRGKWQREDPAVLQARLDALPKAPFTENPSGRAHVETYTVMHGRKGPEYGLVYGRLDSTGERFLAQAPADEATLAFIRDHECLGRPGTVSQRDGVNIFVPDQAAQAPER